MSDKAIVIDKDNIKTEFVLVDPNGAPLYYTLKDGERLIFEDIDVALRMVKPRWTDETWEEMATPKEVEAVTAKSTFSAKTAPEKLLEDRVVYLEDMVGAIQHLTQIVKDLQGELAALKA